MVIAPLVRVGTEGEAGLDGHVKADEKTRQLGSGKEVEEKEGGAADLVIIPRNPLECCMAVMTPRPLDSSARFASAIA